MSKSNAGPIVADRLKSFIERIERLEEERGAIGIDIKDVYSEAKGVGYDVKTMRKVVSLRKMDAAVRAEQEALIDTYMHALGMIDRVEARVASGEPITRATEGEGYSRATFYRVSQRRGEATNETVCEEESGARAEPIGGEAPCTADGSQTAQLPPLESCSTTEPTSEAWAFVTSAREQFEAARKAERDAERERRRAEREAERAENARIDADTLDILPFLRRTQVPA